MTRLLTRRDVASLLDLDDCIGAVEEAFRLHAEGRVLPPGVLGVPSAGGGFHIKAAGLRLERTWFAVKCNANFPGNPARTGTPSIQGLILLYDGDDGRPLAVIDSIEITALRTGAATAVAARRLAREDSRVALICGCGVQGRVQLRSICRVLGIARAWAFDADRAAAARFAVEMTSICSLPVRPVEDLAAAARDSDVCVTCTPSERWFLRSGDVGPGTFVAAVGADHPRKQEIDPDLFARAKVVVDSRAQCAEFGDLRHALAQGTTALDRVHADLAELVSGGRPGRTSRDEITLFDSTGVALEDAAAAILAYRRAVERGTGTPVRFDP